MVRRIQREALRKILSKTSVRSLRVLDHRRVRFQRDVDCRDWVFLRARSSCMGDQCSEADDERSQEITLHRNLPVRTKLRTLGPLSSGPYIGSDCGSSKPARRGAEARMGK